MPEQVLGLDLWEGTFLYITYMHYSLSMLCILTRTLTLTLTRKHDSVLIPEFLIQDHQLEKDQLRLEEYHVSRKRRKKGRTPRYAEDESLAALP